MPSSIRFEEAGWERSVQYILRIICVQSWYLKQHEYKWYVGHPQKEKQNEALWPFKFSEDTKSLWGYGAQPSRETGKKLSPTWSDWVWHKPRAWVATEESPVPLPSAPGSILKSKSLRISNLGYPPLFFSTFCPVSTACSLLPGYLPWNNYYASLIKKMSVMF